MKRFFKGEKAPVKVESKEEAFKFTPTDAKQEKEALERAGGSKMKKSIEAVVLITSLVAMVAALGGCEKGNSEAKEADEDGETDAAGTDYEFVYNPEGVQDYEAPEEAPEEAISAAEAEARAVAEATPEYTPEERLANRKEYVSHMNEERAEHESAGEPVSSDAVYKLETDKLIFKGTDKENLNTALDMYKVADKENIHDVMSVIAAMTKYEVDEATNTNVVSAVEGQSAEREEMIDIIMETIEKPIPEGALDDAQKAELSKNIKDIFAIESSHKTGYLTGSDEVLKAEHNELVAKNLYEKVTALEDPSTSVSVLKYLEHIDYKNWAKEAHVAGSGDYFAYHDHGYEFRKIYNELAVQTENVGGDRVMVYESMGSAEKQEEFINFLAGNTDNVNEDIEDNRWTVEQIKEYMASEMTERAEARVESGLSDEMYELETNFWQDLYKSSIADVGGAEHESKEEAIKLEMHRAAKDGENLEDTLHAYFRLHTKVMGGNFEKSWQTSADLRDQSPEWHEINDLITAEVNEPIPEGELTVEQKAGLVEHIKDLERIEDRTSGVRYDEDIKTGIYEKVRDAALNTKMVELELIARPHMDSYELTHAKDHRGGALANSEHSAEWREIKESLKEKLNSVDGAEYIWSAGPARDELVKLMNDNGVE